MIFVGTSMDYRVPFDLASLPPSLAIYEVHLIFIMILQFTHRDLKCHGLLQFKSISS